MGFLILAIRVLRGFIMLILALGCFILLGDILGLVNMSIDKTPVNWGAAIGFVAVKLLLFAGLFGVIFLLAKAVHFLHQKRHGSKHPALSSAWRM